MNKHYQIAQEEMSFYGPDATSLQNLLAILVGPQADPSITGQLASLGAVTLNEMSLEELTKFEGIGKISAKRILAAFGLANHIRKFSKGTLVKIRTPEDAANIFDDMKHLTQEHFEVLFLNIKNEVIGRKTIFKGTLNANIVHPREIFKEAIRLSAASIICSHNHPSGDPTPSKEDIEVTQRLQECGYLIGIELMDHVIIGHNKFVSLKERGVI